MAIQQFSVGCCEGIKHHIPSDLAEKDEIFLKSALRYIFGDDSSEFDAERTPNFGACQAKWKGVKADYEGLIKHLEISNDQDIRTHERIGKSRFDVFRATFGGQEVAAKRMGEFDKDSIEGLQSFAEFISEACIQATLEHKHIAKLMAVTRSGWLIMELATCNLQTLCHRGRTLNWGTKFTILLQVAEALEYMHTMNPPVIHCDIKSPNILIFGDLKHPSSCTAKITDFGLARFDQLTRSTTMRNPPGTSLWMAPELHRNNPHTIKSDVFSFGVVTYELAAQKHPYFTMNLGTIINEKDNGRPPCKPPSDCHPALVRLMETCCAPEPESRPSIQDVILQLRGIKDVCASG